MGKLTKQRRRGSNISGDEDDEQEEEDEDEEGVEVDERNDRLATLGNHAGASIMSLSAHRGSISEGPFSGTGSGGSFSANASARGTGTPSTSEAAASTALAGKSPLASPPLVVDDDDEEDEEEEGQGVLVGMAKNGRIDGIGGGRKGSGAGSGSGGEKGRLKKPVRAGVERHSSSRTIVPFER